MLAINNVRKGSFTHFILYSLRFHFRCQDVACWVQEWGISKGKKFKRLSDATEWICRLCHCEPHLKLNKTNLCDKPLLDTFLQNVRITLKGFSRNLEQKYG